MMPNNINMTPNNGKMTPAIGNGEFRVIVKAITVQKMPNNMAMALPAALNADGPRPGFMLRMIFFA
jgi:hypothetical protein